MRAPVQRCLSRSHAPVPELDPAQEVQVVTVGVLEVLLLDLPMLESLEELLGHSPLDLLKVEPFRSSCDEVTQVVPLALLRPGVLGCGIPELTIRPVDQSPVDEPLSVANPVNRGASSIDADRLPVDGLGAGDLVEGGLVDLEEAQGALLHDGDAHREVQR
ncbi:hypothetical protein SAMN05444392_11244 [Seinonella peptonophila]|uniref:Uncharacterized protein n=1 Tax=Seinonella peptonophila TaxID=112248 RepID=A0A1M5A6T6_9BACL|nr:hypothetical protein SAMN05444392_11244 [Seinonella peptonophila]